MDRSDETFSGIDIEIEVTGDNLIKEDIETLQADAKRSPVWNFLRLPHDMEPNVTTRQHEAADD